MTNETNSRIEKIEILLGNYYKSEDSFEQTDLAIEIIQDHVGWLVSIAKGAQALEQEKLWLYGRLNMISDIIERGRGESKRDDFYERRI